MEDQGQLAGGHMDDPATSRGVRAEPNTTTAGPTSASAPKPSTNSAWMRRTRQGSMCSQSVDSSGASRLPVVVSEGIIGPRMITGPRWEVVPRGSSWLSAGGFSSALVVLSSGAQRYARRVSGG